MDRGGLGRPDLLWFGVCQVGCTLACLLLWRSPVPHAGWRAGAPAAAMTALLVTAFDLRADPYFVYQLKAWIMAATTQEASWSTPA